MGNQFTKKLNSNKNTPQHLKMLNKHVFCQLNITHQRFSIMKSQRRPKLKEVKIIEIDIIKYCMKANNIKKLQFNIKIIQTTLKKLTK